MSAPTQKEARTKEPKPRTKNATAKPTAPRSLVPFISSFVGARVPIVKKAAPSRDRRGPKGGKPSSHSLSHQIIMPPSFPPLRCPNYVQAAAGSCARFPAPFPLPSLYRLKLRTLAVALPSSSRVMSALLCCWVAEGARLDLAIVVLVVWYRRGYKNVKYDTHSGGHVKEAQRRPAQTADTAPRAASDAAEPSPASSRGPPDRSLPIITTPQQPTSGGQMAGAGRPSSPPPPPGFHGAGGTNS